MSTRADFQCLTRPFWQSHRLIHTPTPAFQYSYDKYLCHINVCCCFFNQFSRVKENNKFTLCSSSQAASLLSVLSVAVLELPCSSCFLLIFLSYIRERHLAFFFFFFFFFWQVATLHQGWRLPAYQRCISCSDKALGPGPCAATSHHK